MSLSANAMTSSIHSPTLYVYTGSENVSRSGVLGTQLRESQYINRSLSAISDVFLALSQKQQHIPYRNSKITHLLADSLGTGRERRGKQDVDETMKYYLMT